MSRLLILLMIASCAKTPATQTQNAAPAQTQSGPRVIFPDGFVVRVEIAADDELRAQGLMYRDRLPDGTGMLFFFAADGDYPFWMKNTRIPLDMIWIGADKRIAHIAHDVPPCQVEDCPSYPPHATARYVLEVNGGVSKEHGLKTGDVLRFVETETVIVR